MLKEVTILVVHVASINEPAARPYATPRRGAIGLLNRTEDARMSSAAGTLVSLARAPSPQTGDDAILTRTSAADPLRRAASFVAHSRTEQMAELALGVVVVAVAELALGVVDVAVAELALGVVVVAA